ncbi:HalOD1 output domain-containing protein [Natrarchaeobaculum sulfurireducens]|uniref:HalOD1 output domain-containing protein n=1 Tax=Natrarchaeobaculum sulfurireducens TaxID=2044521 RepID=UPI00105AB0B2|nr:HalOD1 output domain-containing protein [Natrarchaeobaculum sulfurireducens]
MATGSLELHRRCTPVVDTEYDDKTDAPVVMIAEALADVTGKEIAELPPLHDYIDCGALNQLFEASEKLTGDVVLSFTVEQWNVFVRSDGIVRICDGTDLNEPEPVFED